MSRSNVFSDPEAADRSFQVLASLLGAPLPHSLFAWLEDTADPDLALTNLDRWLGSTTNPGIHLEEVLALPRLGKWLIRIFGSSQSLSDSLIQNPELASILLNPQELSRMPISESICSEGRGLVAVASSYQHSLDRLRYLKQRWILPIAVNDLAGFWPEAVVWETLSELADGLIGLAVEVAWAEFAKGKDLPERCPIMIVSFGKLGGRELNYSSDVDLAYVMPDGVEETIERNLIRFCEFFGRALSDRMGRGSIYRVDLRLRPYGNAGALLASAKAVENYYRLYAEQWEIQALLKSRPLLGPPDLIYRWACLRDENCFRPHLSEPEVESMLAMKSRIEERADEADIKRGAGGIRDVEFLVQVLQLLNGHSDPALRRRGTLESIEALVNGNFLEHSVGASLTEGYTFLRQVEHRCQMVSDRQTHSLPEKESDRRRLALLMGFSSWNELETELATHRGTIKSLYGAVLKPSPAAESDRTAVANRVGPISTGVLHWIDALPEADSYYRSLAENRDSLDRISKVALCAPRLITDLRKETGLTEIIISGEVEESLEWRSVLSHYPLDGSIKEFAAKASRSRTKLLTQWVLSPSFSISAELAKLFDIVLEHCARRLLISFDIVALGSYGGQQVSIESDADVLFLVRDSSRQSEAEIQSQQFLTLLGEIKRSGFPIEIDLRLRPDGGRGMLVRSHDALKVYDLEGMEMWERFALGQARLVYGEVDSLRLVQHFAYAQPLTPPRLQDLLAMKKRVETERVRPQHLRRDIKLGFGGISDIEWLVHLYEMRFPTATRASEFSTLEDRIKSIGRARLLNAIEVEQLEDGLIHLTEVRLRLGLLGLENNIIPENPDKLNRLALSMQYRSGNDFLAEHSRTIESIRAIYLHTLERLKA
jgi:glutamate-ammonia-ligase adenylyltransferase